MGRWTSVDPLADHPNQIMMSPYQYAWNNPVLMTDPDGRCPICPFLAKGAAGAGIDYFIQGAMNYVGGMSVSDAFSPSNIDLGDVAISGLQGALPWSVPGGKYGKAAGAALMDVAINAGKAAFNGEEYGVEQAGTDFLVGFVSQLGAEKAGEFFQGLRADDLLQGGSRLPNSRLSAAPKGRGSPPKGDDGHSVELHHRDGTMNGAIDEMTRTDHRLGDNYRRNHPNTNTKPSKINRKVFDDHRKAHWRREYDSGRFDNLPDQ